MPLTETAREAERARMAQRVLELVKERGCEIPYSVAMAESGLSRARFEQLFAEGCGDRYRVKHYIHGYAGKRCLFVQRDA